MVLCERLEHIKTKKEDLNSKKELKWKQLDLNLGSLVILTFYLEA